MVRTISRPRDFAARIEHLEDRRVMSADPLGVGIEHHDVDEQALAAPLDPPPLDQHVLGAPDFWIDSEDAAALDEYFGQVEQHLTEAHNQTGWFNVRNNYGFTGRGQTVAVIDSGIAYNHFALGGGYGANYRVVGGWDFTENEWNPFDDDPSGGHGTHVSGIIGSSSSTHSGVAPGVDLVGLRVFDDAGAGYFSWVESALRWVHQNRNAYENPITAVNLSLGVSSWNAATVPSWAMLEDEFAQLEADGIFIAVSAGNSFSSYNAPGLSYPAASPYVVPVMSTDDNGLLSYFSQRLDRAIAAPGRSITSTIPDYMGNQNGAADDFGGMSGTSMAAPYVAGASVLIREAMQFVGMTNITQDMIYNHMMATADVLFDVATNLSYKRLDLQSAIDALMPADDFGSSLAAAHNLGALSGTVSQSGAINNLSDTDFFRFTAGSTGNVTFNVTAAGQQMTPSWQAYGSSGQTLATQNGNTVTFAVTAGQTYTVRLSSTGGVGHYSFTASNSGGGGGWGGPSSYQDWGAVAYKVVNDQSVSGERWYRLTASQSGVLTVQGVFNPAAGSLNLSLYDANQQVVASGYSYANWIKRVDVTATAGAEYFLRVTGGNSDVDFKSLNLLSQSGSNIAVSGTAGNDAYLLAVGANYALNINGVVYSYSAATPRQFTFNGGAGDDLILLYGGTGAETATLEVGSASLVGANYSLTAMAFETQIVHGGGGRDVVNFQGSVGDDDFTAWSNRATLVGAGYHSEARGFAVAKAVGGLGGNDEAVFYDTVGNDRFIAGYVRAILTGYGYWTEAEGFDYATAHATAGGYDSVEFYGSAGDDVYTAWANQVALVGAGYHNEARGFDRSKAWAGSGGNDESAFYDTAGNDLFIAGCVRAILTGYGYWNEAEGFDQNVAHATGGGYDRVDLYGSPGDDVYTAWSDRVTLSGAGYYNEARGFEKTKALSGGGNDQAVFYDTAGDDRFIAGHLRAILTGAGYWNEAEGFQQTVAHAIAGGNDRAELYDSPSADSLTGTGSSALLQGPGFRHQTNGFDAITAHMIHGGANSVDIQATDYLFNLLGQ